MDALDIKYALARRGLTLTALGAKAGTSVNVVSQIVNHRKRSLRIAHAVAQAIDRDLFEVFPEYLKPKKQGRRWPKKAA